MSDSDLLRGPITDKYLETSAPALAAATRKKAGQPPIESTPFCKPGKKKPSKKAPAKKKPAKKK